MKSSSRNGAKVIWLAVHTTEGMMRVQALRDWAGWPGSSHAASDETGALWGPEQGFVPYDRAAWTLRNGNPISENIEQCGWARWTRAEWLARPKLLDATARWLAERSKARGIPLVKLSPAEVRARKPGVLGHGDYSTGTGDGTHWDPGPGYPWDVVMDKARAYAAGQMEDDMQLDDRLEVPGGTVTVAEALAAGWEAGRGKFDVYGADGKPTGRKISLSTMLAWFDNNMTAIRAAAAIDEGDVEALRPMLAEAVQAGQQARGGASAEQIVDELVARLAKPAA
jgi:hypothetical protein